MKEIWKAIYGYETKYEVSNFGRVRSLRKNLIMTPQLGTNGYMKVMLKVNGTKVNKEIHRLVGQAFAPLIEGKSYINHIDGDKLNNHYYNIEWVTQKENVRHSMNLGMTSNDNWQRAGVEAVKTPINQYDKSGNLIQTYDSIQDGATAIGVSHSTLWGALNGRQNSSGGYKWKYK